MGEKVKLYQTKVSQVESEIAGLIGILQRENVTRFLEVGSRFGGSLWRIAQALPKGSLIVSCDSGKGMGGHKKGAVESLKECVAALRADGYDAHLVRGHSQHSDVIEQVAAFAPFDAAFIDGDHEYDGVAKDWKNYGRMSRIVAFHDVGWQKPPQYMQIKEVDVPRLWDELKPRFRHEEFIDRSTGGNMGIGVLWRE